MNHNICRRLLTHTCWFSRSPRWWRPPRRSKVRPQSIRLQSRPSTTWRRTPQLKAFQVESATTTDEVQDDGQLIQDTAKNQLRRPDAQQASATASSDRNERTFIYDGKTFTMFAQRAGYYATVPAPPTLRELDDALSEKVQHRAAARRSLPLRFSGLEGHGHQGGHGHRPERGQRHHLRALCVPAGRCRLAGLDSEGRISAAAQTRHHDDDRSRAAAAHGHLHLESGAVIQRGVVHVRAAGRRQEDRPGRAGEPQGGK